MALVGRGFSDLWINEVAYRQLVDPAVTIEVAVVWKKDKQLPWLQGFRQIAREVTQQEVINEQH